jgi:uncharacterized protein (DUF4415 family)
MKKKSTNRIAKPVTDRVNPEWTREDFARAVPFSNLPAKVRQAISSRRRGAQKAPRKVPVSIRLSPEVVKAFRASGVGWQSRVDEILRAHLK